MKEVLKKTLKISTHISSRRMQNSTKHSSGSCENWLNALQADCFRMLKAIKRWKNARSTGCWKWMQREATVSNNYVEKNCDGKLQTARRSFHETINSASSLSVSSSFMKGSLFPRRFVFVPRFLSSPFLFAPCLFSYLHSRTFENVSLAVLKIR